MGYMYVFNVTFLQQVPLRQNSGPGNRIGGYYAYIDPQNRNEDDAAVLSTKYTDFKFSNRK